MSLEAVLDERGWRLLERGGEDFGSLFDSRELFDAFLNAEEHTEGPGTLYFNYEVSPRVFSRQHGARTPSVHLPKRSDGSFEGYAERIQRELKTEHYCLRLTELHAYAPAIWKRLCALLLPLQPALEKAGRTVRTTVFVGHYQYTPFGVHVDPYPQIQCVTEGAREALFWDADYWKPYEDGNAARLAPWDHLAAAHRLPMTKGDAVFWAAFEEHAFSSSGGFAMALTISFPEIEPSAGDLEVVRRRSAHHFLNVPLPVESSSPRIVRGLAQFPLQVVETALVGGGHAFALDLPVEAQRRFVDRVNAGHEFSPEDVARDLGVDLDSAQSVIDIFATHHVLEGATT